MICSYCGREFEVKAWKYGKGNSKYCKECAVERRRESGRKRSEEFRSRNRLREYIVNKCGGGVNNNTIDD